ncbi:MAG TPA: hypothetical protein VHB72_02890 [Candidatus Saccharimonadales bacterium]|nr:hypothetical protein [Candidatus Saccharimonadales bacterium]
MNRIGRFVNNIFEVHPEDADWKNPAYANFRSSLTGSNVGVVTVFGGLALKALTGAETGVDAAAGGAVVTCFEGLRLAINSDRIRNLRRQ